MDDPEATVPVPKPTPQDGGGITDSAVGALFDAASPAFATQRTSPSREWQPPSVEELQAALPQYEITQFIARGGMGAVYKGTQKALKRAVAIKVLPPEIEDGDIQYAERFKREAQSMAQLTHPNIVAVYDAGEVYSSPLAPREEHLASAGGERLPSPGDDPAGVSAKLISQERDGHRTRPLLYFVMEYIEGTDVHQLIQSEKRLDPARALSITTAVCDALAFAHEEGIIHRDIKPSNIMLDKKGRVKVADFGLAKAVNLDSTLLTGSNVAMGTPDFIAPEALIAGMQVDQRADIYAVGVMLYQMLTGRIPRGRFALPSGVIPQIDPRLDAIVDKAMQTERDKRYSTAQEMKADVERVCRASVPDASQPSHRDGLQSKAKSRARLLFGFIAGSLVLAAAAFFALKKPANLPASGSSVSPSPSLPVSKSSSPLSPSTEPWVNVMRENALRDPDLFFLKGVEVTPQGLRFQPDGTIQFARGPQRDGAVRMLAKYEPGKNRLYLRARSANKQLYRLSIPNSEEAILARYAIDTGKLTPLSRFRLPVSLRLGQDYELELRAVGTRFTVKFDGKVIGEVEDASNAEGTFGIGREGIVGAVTTIPEPALVKALEYLNLDSGAASPSPSLPVSKSPQFPPGKWVKAITKFEDIPAIARNNGFLEWREGWIAGTSPKGSPVVFIPGIKGRNQGIRLHGKMTTGVAESLICNIGVRRMSISTEGKAIYRLSFAGAPTSVGLFYYDEQAVKNAGLPSKQSETPLKPGDEFDMELIAIGDKLYSKFNGKPLPVVTDARLTEGEMGFQTRHLARDIEVINLDGLSEAEALKAAGLADGSASPSLPVSKASSSLSPSTEAWINLMADKSQLYLKDAEVTPQGLRLLGKGMAGFTGGSKRDGAIRMSATLELGKPAPYLRARSANQIYKLAILGGTKAVITRWDDKARTGHPLAEFPLPAPLKAGEDYQLELRAVGSKLSAKLNGKLLGEAEDSTLAEGAFGIGSSEEGPVLLKALEYLELGGGAVSPSPSLPVSKSSSGLSPSTEPWADALREKSLVSSKEMELTPQGLRFPGMGLGLLDTGPTRDGAIRMRTAYDAAKQGPQLRARTTPYDTQSYMLVIKDGRTAFLHRLERTGKEARVLGVFPLPAPLQPGEDYELELRIVGSKLTAKFNGKVLGEAEDTTIGQGRFGVARLDDLPALIKSLEYLDLSGGAVSPSPSPLVSKSPQFPPGKWTKVFTTFEEFRAATWDRRDFAWRDGWIDASASVSPSGPVALVPGSKGRNGGIRLHGKIAEGVGGSSAVNISVRRTGTPSSCYQIHLRGMDAAGNVGLTHYDAPTVKSEDLRVVRADPKPQPGDEFDMELIAIGDKLYGKFNGKPLPVVTDTRLTEGEMGFQTKHLARDIEVINLDGLSEAEALKAAGVEGK